MDEIYPPVPEGSVPGNIDEPRRSRRPNLGVPPDRYGDWEDLPPLPRSRPLVREYAARSLPILQSTIRLPDGRVMNRTTVPAPRDDDTESQSSFGSSRTALSETSALIRQANLDEIQHLEDSIQQHMRRLDLLKFQNSSLSLLEDAEGQADIPNDANLPLPLSTIADTRGMPTYRPTPAPRRSLATPPPPPSFVSKTRKDEWKTEPFPVSATDVAPVLPAPSGGKADPPEEPPEKPKEDPPAAKPVSAEDALANALMRVLGVQSKTTEKFIARQSLESKLPFFSGNPLDWPLFRHHFQQSTEDCGFTPAQNMARLEKSLKGEARTTVKALMIVPSNTAQVMRRLEERYGRPEFVIQALVEMAKKTPTPRDNKLASIIDYSNAILNLVTTIEAMEQPAHLQNPSLMKELVDKLPDNLKLQWGQIAMKSETRTLTEFSSWVSDVATAASFVTTPKFKVEDKKEKKERDYSYAATSESSQSCPVCQKEGHAVWSCDVFKKADLQRRWDIVKNKKLCFLCLKPGHGQRNCQSKRKCGVEGCSRKHNRLLHPKEESRNMEPKMPIHKSTQGVSETNGNVNLPTKSSVLLRVLPVKLFGPGGEMVVNALLDEASTVTMLDAGIAEQLQLDGRSDPLRLRWTNGAIQTDHSSRVVSCSIAAIDGGKQFQMTNVRTVRNLAIPAQSIDVKDVWDSWPHLQKVNIKYLGNRKPDILIGQPHIALTVAREVIEETDGSPMLTRTRLGWVLHGPTSNPAMMDDSSFFCFHQAEMDSDIIHNLVKESFQLEAIGIQSVGKLRSKDDTLAEAKMEQVTSRVGDRWETGLLWRDDQVNLSDSYSAALKRLMGVERKLARDDNLRKEYKEKISHYLSSGYARLLSKDELTTPSQKQWFLPHFATTHPNKPGKIRIVFDAASRSGGASLNDYLLTGPDLLVSLPGVLLKFRQRVIGFTGDIAEMFHQVRIRKEDCPAQRFLWRDKPDELPKIYQLEVMMFGSVCSPFCAQDVKNRNAREFAAKYPAAVRAILEKHYMDDYLDSSDTIHEASSLISDVTEVHRLGGFQIGKWVTNSPELLSRAKVEGVCSSGVYVESCIPGAKRPAESQLSSPARAAQMDVNSSSGHVESGSPGGLGLPERLPSDITRCEVPNAKNLADWSSIETERVLGLHWDFVSDVFTFRVKLRRAGDGVADGERVPTKREILRLVMLIFDPLGFINHFTVKARILLQHLWRIKIGWDDELPTAYFKTWRKWIAALPDISRVRIPRCYSADASSSSEVQLHVFADASEAAYCAVAYLRVLRSDGAVDVNLVMSKARVSPIKPASIPRLELQAALIATRLGKFILDQLDIRVHDMYLWTDSRTVLMWIRSEARRYQQFVANRVGEIQESSSVSQWRWVPTKLNVADDATREGRTDLSPESRWWSGPRFLKDDPSDWPVENLEPQEADDTKELKREFVGATFEPPELPLPDVHRFSNFNRLVRATAWVLRFVDCLKEKGKQKTADIPLQTLRAEYLLINQCQWQTYPSEMAALSNGEIVSRSSSLFELSPCLDHNGVMRMDSRLVRGDRENLRQPIILSQHHHLTKILIAHYHRQLLHMGQDLIINEIRQRFWIPHIRSAVRKVIRDCRICKLRKVKACTPKMGALPEFRITQQSRPFTIVGMDYFGPMEVTIGRRHEKRYGVLFTCLTTRAIHLEIAHSLTTDSCILAIRRMIGRRGQPTKIHSDNGTNLRGADKELRQALDAIDQTHMEATLETRGIRWHFIPPSSPHMGGSWERLVRSVKDALKTILKSRAPKEEVLQTVFAEAEAIVNSRPLTDIPVDPDSPEALTPMHFLIGTSSALQPPGEFDDHDVDLTKRWRSSQRLADMFWNRWVREYLPTLQRRTKWHGAVPPVEVGDVVVILDESLKRNTWPLGVVVAVFPGKDGQVRVAEVRTSHGVYRRPVVKLGKLDIKTTEPPI